MKARLGLALLLGFIVGCAGTGTPSPSIVRSTPSGQPATTAAANGNQIATDPAQDPQGEWGIREDPNGADYPRVIERVSGMVRDANVVRGATRRGLSVMNVMWEDTGRAQGSALGPNITDLTLQVRRRDASGSWTESLMPVIRFPNFTDRTGDVRADKFFVRVGNERSAQLSTVPLTDVLRNLRGYVSDARGLGVTGSLLAARDTHFLVSSQAVFLPIPRSGKAEFNPVVFNYQSAPGSPAVLTMLVTREGTSIRVIENRPEDQTSHWGQELYFNNKGQRTAFTAERKSDVAARIQAQGGPKTDADKSALAKGADVLFLVQIPLVHKNRGYLGGAMPSTATAEAASGAAPAKEERDRAGASDVEQAVLGHGPNLGPYHEGTGQTLVRDPQFPIRITVQFYKATSNGVVSEADLDGIARSIGSVFEHADFVGSLVVPEGDPRRPTSWQTVPNEWFPW
ncbi:MAG: hypothetical protein HY898_04420 [Deltaproteobacteria bacterium]|nr:hypothetical protein [Deltaproteobacteria bacterium]